MASIILTTALGVVTAIVVLLFRRLADIDERLARTGQQLDDTNRQITQVRVEVALELMHLTGRSTATARAGSEPPAAQAAVNGDTGPPPSGAKRPCCNINGQKPHRCKDGLALYGHHL